MTTAHDIDWPAVLAERLTTIHPDVLRELPPTPYEYATWKRCRVDLDYHVDAGDARAHPAADHRRLGAGAAQR